jgi:hypothetical protein
MYGAGVTLKISRVNARAEMPACVDHVASGHFHPEHVITRKTCFEDAMRRSAIRPFASPLFAMALNRSI